MRHAWLALILLITGCVQYPVNPDGSAWNSNGINYPDPNAAPVYGGSGYNSYTTYPYLGYPCSSVLGCGAFVPFIPVVRVAAAAPASAAVTVAKPANVGRARTGGSLRSGGRGRGRR